MYQARNSRQYQILQVKAMYFVSGWSKNSEDGALELKVVTEDKLEQTKNELQEILLVHIYSVTPQIPQNLNSIRMDDRQLITDLHKIMKVGEVEPGQSPLERNTASQVICRNVCRKQIPKITAQQPRIQKNTDNKKESAVQKTEQEKQPNLRCHRCLTQLKSPENMVKIKSNQQKQTQAKKPAVKQSVSVEKKEEEQQQQDILDSDVEDQVVEEEDFQQKFQKHNIIESENDDDDDEQMDVDTKQDKINDGKRKILELVDKKNPSNIRVKKRKVQKYTFNDKGEEVVETVEEEIPENELEQNENQLETEKQQKSTNLSNQKFGSGFVQASSLLKKSGISVKSQNKQTKQAGIKSFFKTK
eukprot:TRINITY_DN1952_c0_g1_i1.p1 TRINITY_DN1952_c0_g1~~TRINITY_DN1952_c0_g1_i1.p1  ORF type:complete len:359 (+),score=66.80 TRINITY_DN1952_c0_g1_i1:262-1338(+)